MQAYIARCDAADDGDIGVENATPQVIREALEKALARAHQNSVRAAADDAEGRFRSESSLTETCAADSDLRSTLEVTMRDLTELGLAGCEGASERRAAVCKGLGIGYGNAAAMIRKLKGFGIGIDELREEVEKGGAR